jgi:hydrogenase maturation protease
MARVLNAEEAALAPQDRAPWLLLAWGNDSRGDDALGPRLAEALAGEGWAADPRVEILVEMQLQVEHVLDLAGRAGVLMVDASHALTEARLRPLRAEPDANLFSHALRPEALLQAYRQVLSSEPPPAWLLELPAAQTELGTGLGEAARRSLARGLDLARDWLRQRPGVARSVAPLRPRSVNGHADALSPLASMPRAR